MATATSLPITRHQTARLSFTDSGSVDVLLCTAFALLLLGYHPAAEDGGIYSAAVAARLHPRLFPAEHAFAEAHTGYDLFLPVMVFLVHALHLSLATVLLLTYIAATLLTLAAAQFLLKTLFPHRGVQRGALLLFAASLGLPIAGTSLYLIDPYLTARSFSTPLLLFSLAFLLRERMRPSVLCGACALLFHPLMTLWATPVLAMQLTVRSSRPVRNTALLASALFAVMAAVQWFGPTDSLALRYASLSRDYWFVTGWAPYEWLGLVAPPLMLLLFARLPPSDWLTHRARQLAEGTALATTVTALTAACLIHASNSSLLLARMQPLRLLHFTYCVFLLLFGGWLASLQRGPFRHTRWIFIVGAAGGLLFMQRQLYDRSGHVELPGRTPVNGYSQAFLWIRGHTPADALFALDANYTRDAGEDAQLFRAVSLRSSLPDAAKDGGIASVVPSLAPAWAVASRAQTGLATLTDTERLARVRPLGATWIVLPAASATHLPCPYRNRSALVCHVP